MATWQIILALLLYLLSLSHFPTRAGRLCAGAAVTVFTELITYLLRRNPAGICNCEHHYYYKMSPGQSKWIVIVGYMPLTFNICVRNSILSLSLALSEPLFSSKI